MGSEGYLINQFLAARTNDRTDRWGGSARKRMRFPVEIVRRTREAVGEGFPIMYRISLLDLVEGGQTWDEVVELAGKLEEAGVTVFNTGIGWHEARVPTIITQVPRGRLGVRRPRGSTEVVDVPVCASNRINTPEMAEEIIASGQADLVSMARPFLADPDFVAKALDDRADEINTCIACNQACLDHTFSNQRASCLVNPRACHETELVLLPTRVRRPSPSSAPARPAWPPRSTPPSAASRSPSSRSTPSSAASSAWPCRCPARRTSPTRCATSPVASRCSASTCGPRTEATAADLAAYDHVVVATGVVPRMPAIEGIDHPKAVSYADVLDGSVTVGKRVAVIGAGGIGVDVSHFLTHDPGETVEDWYAHWGVGDPTLQPGRTDRGRSRVRRRARSRWSSARPRPIGIGLGKTSGWAHRAVLKQSGVTQVSGATYDRIDDAGLHITVDGDARACSTCDHVVICAGPGVRARPVRRPRPPQRATSSAARTSPPSSTPSGRSSRAPRSSRRSEVGGSPDRRSVVPMWRSLQHSARPLLAASGVRSRASQHLDTSTLGSPTGPPSTGTALGELGAALDAVRLVGALPRLATAPRGDGHLVVDIPGWRAPEVTGAPLRGYLRASGLRRPGLGLRHQHSATPAVTSTGCPGASSSWSTGRVRPPRWSAGASAA